MLKGHVKTKDGKTGIIIDWRILSYDTDEYVVRLDTDETKIYTGKDLSIDTEKRFGDVWWVSFKEHKYIANEPNNVCFSRSDSSKLCVPMFVCVIDNDRVWKKHIMDLCVEFVLDCDVDTPLPKLESVHIEFFRKLTPVWKQDDFCAEEHEALKKHILEHISIEEICEYAKKMLILQDTVAVAKGEN